MKEITLTQGKVTLVDDDDFDWLSRHKWCFNSGYAMRNISENGKQRSVRMHRLINKTPIGVITDHINGDGLDNRKVNLRSVTHAQNIMNSRKPVGCVSGFKGVTWSKQDAVWRANIKLSGKKINLGYFDSEIEAAKKYDEAASRYFGEYARLNFAD